MSDDELMHSGGASPDDQSVPEQSEPMSPSGDMGEPLYDVAGVALGAVSPDEAAEVRAAAAADPGLAAELAAMREVVAELSRVEPLEMINRGRSAGIRSRLVARAAASRSGRPAARQSSLASSGNAGNVGNAGADQAERSSTRDQRTAAASGAGRNRQKTGPQTVHHDDRIEPRIQNQARTSGLVRTLGWLALAASIAFAATATQLWRVSREHQQLTGALASQRSTLVEKVSQLEASVAARDSVITALTGTTTRVIDLASLSSMTPAGRMFWNQKTQEWTMYAFHLKRPPTGKTYQLWLIASGHPAPISAGTFAPDAAGSAVMRAKYALAPGTLKRIAVTEEPDGGVAAPTGPVVFGGVGR